jgi:hypothetical protein
MENDQIFEAEATLEGEEYEQSRLDYTSGRNAGVRTMMASNSGYDKHIASTTTEETPLLPNGSGNDSGPSDADNENTGLDWQGETDFEGLPWWRKPSVRPSLVFALNIH